MPQSSMKRTLNSLEQEFANAYLVVPKHTCQADSNTTSSRSIMQRSRGTQQPLEWRRDDPDAEFSVPNKLQKLGLENIQKLQTEDASSCSKGIFSSLNALGVTAAYFCDEKEENDAKSDLDSDYLFLPNFPLFLTQPITHDDARGYRCAKEEEWRITSGVAEAHEQNIRGQDVLVGVLDSGIDADHQEFSRPVTYRYVSLFPQDFKWPPRDVRGFDPDGHGTHVCGIVGGNRVGIAPESKLYVASVIESGSSRTDLIRVAAGLEWLLSHFSRPENENLPAVLNMSLGFSRSLATDIESDAEFKGRLKTMRKILQMLIKANILPIAAIGNEGQDNLRFPAGFKEILGIGAVDFNHQIFDLSGSGQADEDGNVSKPDLVGYGVNIYSSYERDYEGSSLYKNLSGTSMAAPYVTGIAALYFCQEPSLTPEDVRAKLLNNTLKLNDQPAARVGAGLARFVPTCS